MIAGLAIVASVGVGLAWWGMSAGSHESLRARVEPYVRGLSGRPSGILGPASADGMRRLVLRRIQTSGLASDEGLRARLMMAGDRRGAAAFRLDQLIWGTAATAAVVAVAVGSSLTGRADPTLAPLAGALGFMGGVVARDRSLTRSIERRRERIRAEVPSVLDLLTLTLMAGEPLPEACARVALAIDGELGELLQEVVLAVRSGVPMSTALESLRVQAGTPEVERLVEALTTGIERGAPLAALLRTQASDARAAWTRRMLESAGRREVMMLVPVVFLILPVVILIALIPGLATLDLLVP